MPRQVPRSETQYAVCDTIRQNSAEFVGRRKYYIHLACTTMNAPPQLLVTLTPNRWRFAVQCKLSNLPVMCTDSGVSGVIGVSGTHSLLQTMVLVKIREVFSSLFIL
jgi:hypothetical protein